MAAWYCCCKITEKHAYPDTGAQYDAISTPAVKAVDDLFTQLKEQVIASHENWQVARCCVVLAE
eukprot:SAG31_NODE_389_length_16370_cov_4.517915_12_plen_64_part_00